MARAAPGAVAMAPDARAARPAAPHRIGEPSPLIFHLGAALAGYNQALLAAPRADAPEFPWSAHLAEAAAGLGPGLDRLEIARQIGARLSATARGIEIWQSHPYRRVIDEPPTLWRSGSSRLLDYGATPEAVDPEGPPVLVVPSLINRAYILDLAPGRSMLRWLAAQGLRPVLLDWGAPGPGEAGFGLEEYGTARLLPALEHLRAVTGRRVGLVGYCMGGTLAAGLAARAPAGLGALAVIGAPWDFASTRGIAGGVRAMIRAEGPARTERLIAGLGEAFGLVPVSVFQTLFALVSPMQATLKFQKLARLDPDSAAARHFVALEDWLSDGVPMPAPAASNLLVDWQIRNLTATGRWRFLGGMVDPREIALPTLAFCGQSDTIAPPSLSLALPAAIPGARVAQPRTGHVGMIVGSAARALVWRPLASFLAAHAG
jgi:polyhydroxyalkanoate synthase subunit PhaC